MKKYELFQFTPLREGRHKLIDALKGEYGISIHAPPRGATLVSYYFQNRDVFQFTPLREGRRL